MPVAISVLLLTLDEAANLPRCLDALAWCDDVVVLDSFSTDQTVELARARGARVEQRAFDSFAGQRNHGLETIEFRHPWVLHVDADEVVTPELVDHMARAITDDHFDAYRIPSRTMFRGRWLRFSGMYPSYQVRLTRRGAFRFRQEGHGQKEDVAVERIGTVTTPYTHYAFSRGLHDWIAKHNRYSLQEAEEAVKRGHDRVRWRHVFARDPYVRRQTLRRLGQRVPCRPLVRFLYMYGFRLGFLDGRAGLTYCLLLASYELMIEVKVAELRRRNAGLEP